MATINTDECVCRKCWSKVGPRHKSICCDICNRWFHFRCSKLKKEQFLEHVLNPNKTWRCCYCKVYRCKKCSLIINKKQNCICCDICDNWQHLKCTGLSLNKFKELGKTNDKWFCKSCFNETLPFSSLDNKQFSNLFQNKKISQQQSKTSVDQYIRFCNICKKHNNLPGKAVPCSNCKCLIHRNCTKLPLKSLEENMKQNYLCLSCVKEALPFFDYDYDSLIAETFNSNYDCICTKKNHLEHNTSDADYEIFLNLNELSFNEHNKHFDFDPDEGLVSANNFQYYSTHAFHKLVRNTHINQSFSLMHTNMSSLTANFEKLENLLADLDFHFDVIACTETWNPEDKKHLFTPGILDGYHRYEGITGSSLKGGCGFYIRDMLCYIPRPDLDTKQKDGLKYEFEAKWIEVINKKGVNIIIGVNYRHPRKNDTFYIQYLQKVMKAIKKEKKLIQIVGDFNYNLLNHDKAKTVTEFMNFLSSNLLQPHILGPTRLLDNNKPSINDNILTNFIDKNCKSGNLYDKISDHLPNFIIIEDIYENITKEVKVVKRHMKNFDGTKFIEDLNSFNIFENIINENNVNTKYDIFHDHFLKTLDKHAPFRKLSKKELRRKRKPWITKGIHKSIKVKNKLYKKFVTTKDNFYYTRYKVMRDKINHLLRSEKKKYHNKFFENNKNNMKKIWFKINHIIHKRKLNTNSMCLNVDGAIISDPYEIGNKFNTFYTTVAQKLVDKMKKPVTDYSDYLKDETEKSFYMQPTCPSEVEKLIINLDCSKSSDIYDISVKIVKISSNYIANILSHIFNKSFLDGIFPQKLKYAFVLPMHKGALCSLALSVDIITLHLHPFPSCIVSISLM